jgi:hypothetical protein
VAFCVEIDRCDEASLSRQREDRFEQPSRPRGEALCPEQNPGDMICASTLLAWAAEEAGLLACVNNQSAYDQWRNAGCQDRIIACVLLYCYATQMLDHEEIARACRIDPILQCVCGGSTPFIQELRSFRRRNRRRLERLLANVLLKAMQQKCELRAIPLPANLKQMAQTFAAQELDIARHFDVDEP